MITPPSDHGRPVALPEGGAIVRLVQHAFSRTRALAPADNPARSTHQDEHVDATAVRRPTTAESYGCVDWFQF